MKTAKPTKTRDDLRNRVATGTSQLDPKQLVDLAMYALPELKKQVRRHREDASCTFRVARLLGDKADTPTSLVDGVYNSANKMSIEAGALEKLYFDLTGEDAFPSKSKFHNKLGTTEDD